MNEDIDMFFMSEGSSYLESLIKSRYLVKLMVGDRITPMIEKLEHLIDLELDLAIAGANKATSEVKKATVTPLKGV